MPHRDILVLVVDDHEDFARAMTALLSRQGFAVRTAFSFAEALRIALAETIDVLVADIDLHDPDQDGCDLMRAIAALYPVRGVAVTGHVQDAQRRKCEEAGFRAFVSKPVAPDQLLAAMQRAGTPR